jgi:hypothetical protein
MNGTMDEIIADATKKMNAIANRNDSDADAITDHIEADRILIQFLKDIRADEMAVTYEAMSEGFYYS